MYLNWITGIFDKIKGFSSIFRNVCRSFKTLNILEAVKEYLVE